LLNAQQVITSLIDKTKLYISGYGVSGFTSNGYIIDDIIIPVKAISFKDNQTLLIDISKGEFKVGYTYHFSYVDYKLTGIAYYIFINLSRKRDDYLYNLNFTITN
jgi:hypothetical protein